MDVCIKLPNSKLWRFNRAAMNFPKTDRIQTTKNMVEMLHDEFSCSKGMQMTIY